MKKIVRIIAVSFVLLVQFANADAKNIKLSNEVLMDKIKGAWAGQTIGCTYGGPTEFKYCGKTIADTVEIKWPEHYMKWYYDHEPGLYDDIYMDLTFVDVFEKKGLDAPIEDFANAFAYAGYKLWHANLQARANILMGIMPPASGYWKNNPHADDIDFQIEADYAGIMSPGMPNTAAYYCDEIGHIMNYGDGWYGGVYVAAMYSLAFIYDDINVIVKEALKTIPAESRYARCISDVIKWYAENPEDWRATWNNCQEKYNDDLGCPSELGGTFRIDAVINGAYIVIGLLYGQGDFDKTLEISCRCGQDSDCNPASAGGVLATMLGYSRIPQKWIPNLKEVEDDNFAYTDISLNRVYSLSFNHALQVIRRTGGKVNDNGVVIKVEKPRPVRWEQSFEGLELAGIVNVDQHAFGQDVEFSFEGNGIVLEGRLRNKKGGDFVTPVDVEIDGKPFVTVDIKEDNYTGQDHILHAFDLSDGKHTVKVHARNQRKDKQLWVNRGIIYKNAR